MACVSQCQAAIQTAAVYNGWQQFRAGLQGGDHLHGGGWQVAYKNTLHAVLQERTVTEIDLTPPFLGRNISLLPLTINSVSLGFCDKNVN